MFADLPYHVNASLVLDVPYHVFCPFCMNKCNGAQKTSWQRLASCKAWHMVLSACIVQDSHDALGRQSPEAPAGLSMTHMHAVPPKDIAAAWNVPSADMHRPVDAAAAFNNGGSYSTAFLSSNGHASQPSGQALGHAQSGSLHGHPHGQGNSKGSFVAGANGVFGAASRGSNLQQPPGLICPLTKVRHIGQCRFLSAQLVQHSTCTVSMHSSLERNLFGYADLWPVHL